VELGGFGFLASSVASSTTCIPTQAPFGLSHWRSWKPWSGQHSSSITCWC